MDNKKRKNSDTSETAESSSSSDEEDPVDIEEIARNAIQELLEDEDFQRSLLLPHIQISIEEGPPPEPENPYLSSLNPRKREKLMTMEKRLFEKDNDKIPLKYRILDSDITDISKRYLIEKINNFATLQPHSSEFQKQLKFMRGVEKIPFGIHSRLPVSKNSSPEKIKKFMQNIYESLTRLTYGQEEAKSNILEVVAKWISNPKGNGNVIGLCGPPGIGKTSLIKNGLSTSLKMPFSFIGLGGTTCSASLQGHDYTYEGSKWGRIVEILIETQTMNPIIFFDELDKVSETKHGEEVIGLLTHLTDPSQNNSFHDKYFSGIDFDLSKCLFIFSFNNENKINPILKDRIKIIRLKGFKSEDKIEIAKKYSISKISKNVGFSEEFSIPDETLSSIIESYCPESGVRKLEKCIETLIMKLNLYSMTQNPKSLSKKGDLELEKPYKITPEIATSILDPIFGKEDADDRYKFSMYT